MSHTASRLNINCKYLGYLFLKKLKILPNNQLFLCYKTKVNFSFHDHFFSRLNIMENNQDIPRFDEPFGLIVNGLETSPSASPRSERSRSPSPTNELPSYSISDMNFNPRPVTSSFSYTSSVDALTTNSHNDFYSSSISVGSDEKQQQISQILKEANLNHNTKSNSISFTVLNSIPDVKLKVGISFNNVTNQLVWCKWMDFLRVWAPKAKKYEDGIIIYYINCSSSKICKVVGDNFALCLIFGKYVFEFVIELYVITGSRYYR